MTKWYDAIVSNLKNSLETVFIKKSNISGLLKNDGTVDTTTKEVTSNKISSWSSTTNNTRYPTEKLVKDSLDGKANTSHTHSNYLTSHQDISGKVDKAQGSTNASKNVVTDSNGNITTEAKPTIPTKTSQLTNDSNFLTSHQDISGKADKSGYTANKNLVTNSSGQITTENKPTIPTKTSQLTNDSNFLTSHQDISGKADKSGYTASKNLVTNSSGAITTEDKPTIPSKTSQLTNDSGFLTSHQNISGKVNIAQGSTNASKNVVTDSSGNITTEAKPTIDSALSSTSTNAVQNKVINSALSGKAASNHNHDGTYLKSYTPPTASTSQAGIVQLSTSTSGTSDSKAATESAVKAAYDKGNHSHPYAASSHTHSQYGITVEKQSTAESGYAATYIVKQNNAQVGEKINIPKDFLVKSASMKTCTTANSPISGLAVNDPYLDFVVNTKNNDGTDEHIYINVADLVDTYTAGTGLTLSNGAFSVNYGTTGTTACAGNDSRLSNARTPTSHTHGNITNTGAIGSTANLPVITTTSGKLTTGSFGTTANTFCQGNDSRLSDARTPTAHTHTKSEISDFPSTMTPSSHTHGNLTNDGKLGTTSGKPVITTTGGAITTGSFGTSSGQFAEGNHTHSNYLTSHQDISGKVNVAQGSTNASKNVVTDSSGNITTEAKPTIPTKTSQLTNDSNFLTSHQDISGKVNVAQGSTNANKTLSTNSSGNVITEAKNNHTHTTSQISDFPSTMTPSSHTHTKSEITDFPTSMAPTSHTHGNITNAGAIGSASGKIITTTTNGVLQASNSITKSQISDFPTLATVATSGSYNDLSNKPTIDSALSSFSTNAVQNNVINTALNGKADWDHNHDGTYLKSYTPPTASISQAGIVQLSTSTSGTSTSKAATESAVKAAYDKANHSHPYAASDDSRLSDARTPKFNSINATQSAPQDLNNFTTGGFYYINSNSDATYITNCPPSNNAGLKAFWLLVETWGESATNYVKQTLTYYSLNTTYIRIKSGSSNGWSNWEEIVTNSSKSSSITTDTGSTTKLPTVKAVEDYALPLTGGTMSGNIKMPSAYESTSGGTGNIPFAGHLTSESSLTSTLPTLKSFFGTLKTDNTWWNVLSIRHRNGSGDGSNYGWYLKTALQSNGNLIWNNQYTNSGDWATERTILDSGNYTNYASDKNHTHTKLVSNGALPSTATKFADYKNEGYYTCGSTNSANITDKPYTGSYACIIENKRYDDDSIIQSVYKMPGSSIAEIYYRKWTSSGGWTIWNKIATYEEIIALNGSNIKLNSNSNVSIETSIASKADSNHTHTTSAITDFPTTMTPTKHDSTESTYGLGSATKFGHCKVINNLTQTSHVGGQVLSAYQGKVLDDKITAITSFNANPTTTTTLLNSWTGSITYMVRNGWCIVTFENLAKSSTTASLENVLSIGYNNDMGTNVYEFSNLDNSATGVIVSVSSAGMLRARCLQASKRVSGTIMFPVS